MKTTSHIRIIILAFGVTLTGCNEPNEAPRVELPVAVSADGVTTVTNDLGYEIEVTEARMAFNSLGFTIAGELHTQLPWKRLTNAIISNAYAHPGHYSGGEVTGELPGEFVVDWLQEDGRQLGTATLLGGTYTGANFTFARGSSDHLADDDPLIGHTAIFSGFATREGVSIPYNIVVNSPEGRVLVGAPLTTPDGTPGDFKATIDGSSSGTLRIQLDIEDPIEHHTLFDGIDFAELSPDANGVIHIAPDNAATEDAYNLFRRTFQLSDFYIVHYQE